MLIPSYHLHGSSMVAKPFYIGAAVAVTKGQIVYITPGTGVAAMSAPTDADDVVAGVAAEAHDGVTAGRQSGTEILVYVDPDIVYELTTKHLSTTTGGSASTWVDSSLGAANDIFNGGKIVIVSTNSITGFSVGDVLSITDYVSSNGTCTVSGAKGTIAAGMTGYIWPGKQAAGYFGFDLDSGADDIDYDTAGGETLQIVEVKLETTFNRVFVKVRLAEFGDHVVAL